MLRILSVAEISMNDISDGELKFTNRQELEAWLEKQPREVSVVIAARAALRVLPLLYQIAKRDQRRFASLTFVSFWSSAAARIAAKYPTRAHELRVYADLAAYAASAYASAYAALDASTYAARATASAPEASAYAALAAAYAFAASARADTSASPEAMWTAVSADANWLKSGVPRVLASEKLWLGKAPPKWAQENYSILLGALKEPHWRPWRDWYQRRLDGVEAPENIELLFATLPIDPREKDVAEQNADLGRRIAELQEARPAKERRDPANNHWDFFISYSNKDEAEAREIAGILEQAGHSTFAQFKDIAPGNNFVREMQQGLESSRRFVALLSPAYEASNHCQAEWAAAYNHDPSGAGRRILPLLVRKTNLNALESQINYVDLVGLSGEARRQAILRALAPKPIPNPIENISAPFDFGWNAAHRIAVVAGPQNTPIFPFAGSDHDHRDRLDACRKTVERLLADLAAQRFNARPDYRLLLETYLDELPAAPGGGNLLLADAEARVLRGLFEEDVNILSRALAERLNRILEFHIALRPFYPGVGRFYDDVRSGALSAPLPRDAIAGFVETVREYTPDIFEPSVSRGIDKVEEDFAPHPAAPAPQLEPGVLAPRPDPIDAPDPEKTQAYSLTSTINAVYRVFREGKDMAAAIKGWDEAAQKLGEHAGPVIEFLKSFLPNA